MKTSELYREAALSVLRDNDQSADVKLYIIAELMERADLEARCEKSAEEREAAKKAVAE